MALNPLAAEFVPQRHKTETQEYTGLGRDGTSLRERETGSHDLDSGTTGIGLYDVPKDVLATIFGKLPSPADVLATALVNKHMLEVASEAALKLRIGPQNPQWPCSSFLKAAHSIFQGVRELDMNGCSTIEDEDIVNALGRLPAIQVLDLSACRKLTGEFLTRALVANHKAQPKSPGNRGYGGLQVLGLQRCFQLDSFALTDILSFAASYPSSLSVVTLSHLTLDKWPMNWPLQQPSTAQRGVDVPRLPAAHSIQFAPLKILALHNCKNMAADGLAFLAACCPVLEMLFLGGSSLDIPIQDPEDNEEQTDSPTAEPQRSSPQIMWGVRSLAGFYRRSAAAIADAVQTLTKLRVLELTFYDQRVVSRVAKQLSNVQVWEFTKPASLEAAQQLKEEHGHTESGSGILLALSAAANCSSQYRHTPLHDAVSRDCRYSIQVLLKLGSFTEAKDRSGATPLFLACEIGRLKCAAELMSAGAELRSTNSSGEAPLYIAALRGFDSVVQELLIAFRERGLKWTESNLYGDKFNPLMAATVGDRHSIAMILLKAAGPDAESLVMATNRYGQSAIHIAARKGSHLLLRALIDAAGGLVALMPDNNGKTPLAVARANQQEQAAHMLQQAANAFRSECPKKSPRATRRYPLGRGDKFEREKRTPQGNRGGRAPSHGTLLADSPR